MQYQPMRERMSRAGALGALLLVLSCSGSPTPGHDTTTDTNASHPTEAAHGDDLTVHGASGEPWTMFRRDPLHTASVPGVGAIGAGGPTERWRYRLSEPSEDMRWFSTFPLGDLDGNGAMEVVVTSAVGMPGVPASVVALTATGESAEPLWTFRPENPEGWVDQYGAALVDADGDDLLDVVFASFDGYVRAVDGATGRLIWEYSTGRIMESGPMVADLDGDGRSEVIQVTDCVIGTDCAPSGALLVFASEPTTDGTENPPLWQVEFPWKVDSGEPAIADLDSSDGRDLRQIVFGGWGGRLLVVWRDPGGDVIQRDLVLATLDPATPNDSDAVAVRTSPLIADFGEGATAVFGWMPDYRNYRDARLSAIGISVSTEARSVEFTHRWTEVEDAWKSSPALLETGERQLVVTGAGYALGGFGRLACDDVAGRYVARDGSTGELVWAIEMPAGQGDLRGSVAVADVDGDGAQEVVAGVGCGGRLLGIDGASGEVEWERQLGPNLYVSPSLADIDGDGFLEIVIGSHDGNVYAFGA